MAYLEKLREFVKEQFDNADTTEKADKFNDLLNEITKNETDYNKVLTEYKKLINNREVEKTTDYANMSFDDMLSEFSNKNNKTKGEMNK